MIYTRQFGDLISKNSFVRIPQTNSDRIHRKHKLTLGLSLPPTLIDIVSLRKIKETEN